MFYDQLSISSGRLGYIYLHRDQNTAGLTISEWYQLAQAVQH